MKLFSKRLGDPSALAFVLPLVLVCLALMTFAWLSWSPVARAQVTPWQGPPYSPKNISFASSGNQTIVAAPAAGIGTCVYGLLLTNGSAATATTVSVYLDGGTTAVASAYLGANGGAVSWPLLGGAPNPKNAYFITNLATAFVVNSSAAVQVNGTVYAANCP
jgi:hypothetical protein